MQVILQFIKTVVRYNLRKEHKACVIFLPELY